ncbi:MAG: 50S ribosomal protein L9 [Legionellales bacterium]|nr:50S ribosomal protein L9 [Legionellales bacterium]|tara:strand:- start:552 stop:1016 length:465 start_codon:yes stop_codon:yes gene_type:complete
MIELLLCESIVNLGRVGDKVSVSDGYARNYLLPYGKAVDVTPENLVIFEKKRKEYEKKEADILEQAKVLAKAVEAVDLVFSEKVLEDDESRLYGSVGGVDIVQQFVKQGVDVKKNQVNIGVGVIKTVGTFECSIALHSEVVVKKIVTVEALVQD